MKIDIDFYQMTLLDLTLAMARAHMNTKQLHGILDQRARFGRWIKLQGITVATHSITLPPWHVIDVNSLRTVALEHCKGYQFGSWWLITFRTMPPVAAAAIV